MRSPLLVGVVTLILTACSTTYTGSAESPTTAEMSRPPYGPGTEPTKVYDYALHTHCGIQWAQIDGRLWETEPLNDGNGNPANGWDNPWHQGTLTVVDHHTATYDSHRGPVLEFRPVEPADDNHFVCA